MARRKQKRPQTRSDGRSASPTPGKHSSVRPGRRSESPDAAEPGDGRGASLPRWKKLLFAAFTCLAFFGILELVFWVADVPTVIEREDPFRGFSGLISVFPREGDVHRTRPAIAGGIFNDQSFLADKPANGVRIFCLGGSTAYGYPWGAEAAFTSIVGEVMAASHPELRVEAVNASAVGYGTHRMNIVADELAAYQPDIFLICMGHNEFIEPAFYDTLKQRSSTRSLEYLLAHTRVYSVMRLAWVKRRQAAKRTELEATVERDQTRSFSPAEKEAVIANFRWGLKRLVRRAQANGAKVVLATVPCNLRQWSPAGSTIETGVSEEDRGKWEAALLSGKKRVDEHDWAGARADLELAARIAPAHAETQFLLGQVYEGLSRWDDARLAYQRACDADAKPVRRLTGMNGAIRSVARESGALLVDIDRIFEQHSEHGLVGFNLIEDAMHPTREGHELIAWHVWEAMEQAGWFKGNSQAQRTLFDKLIAERHKRPVAENAMWLANQAIRLQKQGRIKEAMEKYRDCLKSAPNYRRALLNLGGLLVDSGQNAEAVGVLERLVAIDPKSPFARSQLGMALQGIGRTNDAIACFEEALRIKPDYALGHACFGLTLARVGRLPEAMSHFEEALRIEPNRADTHCYFGMALVKAGKIQEAIDQYEQALRLKPDYAPAHFNLGNALLQTGRVAEAAEHYEKALQLNPEYAAAHFNLGNALLRIGRVAEAAEHYEKALQLNPDYAAVAHFNLGTALQQIGRLPEATAHYEQVLRIDPKFAPAAYRLAEVFAQQGQLDEAAAALEKLLKADPQNVEAHYGLASVLSQQGKHADALAIGREGLRLSPDNVALLNNAAWLLATCPEATLRNGKEAVELARKAIQISGGNDPMLLDTLSAAYAEAGQFPEAIKTAEAALSLATSRNMADLVKEISERIKLYKSGLPFHQKLLPSAQPPSTPTKPVPGT
jgi:tetratricopeptide (TPR) repeat protein